MLDHLADTCHCGHTRFITCLWCGSCRHGFDFIQFETTVIRASCKQTESRICTLNFILFLTFVILALIYVQPNFIQFQVCFGVGNFILLLTLSENVFFKPLHFAIPQLQPIFKWKDHVAFHHKAIVIPLAHLKFDGFRTFIFTVVRVRTLGRAFKIGWVQSMIFAFATSTLHTIGKIVVTRVLLNNRMWICWNLDWRDVWDSFLLRIDTGY